MRKTPRNKPACKKTKALTTQPERTEAEVAYMQDFNSRKTAKPTIPKVIIKKGDEGEPNVVQIEMTDYGMGEALMLDSLGTMDSRFMEGLVPQLANVSVDKFDFMLSVVTGIEPQDQIEVMLAAQMATVHVQIMTFARRLAHVDNIDQQDSAERAFNKLARTFAAQIEALKRYRTGGEQKMMVEHVHVHEGGQAIVGTVQGGANRKQGNKPMQLPLHQARRCGAKTRRGTACQSPAMLNGRCRMHGGKATGAPKGNQNALKQGLYTAQAISERRGVNQLIRECRGAL